MFSIIFAPGVLETEEDFGTLVIDDKNTGSISGTYYYSLTEGVLEFYKEDGTKITDEFYITADIGGEAYYFQSIDFLIQQPLIKVEGMSVLLGGKYTVSGENGVAYEFMFTPGEGEIPEIAE